MLMFFFFSGAASAAVGNPVIQPSKRPATTAKLAATIASKRR
jgi:hypothetical protein